jgi:hypothetical protein
VVKLLVGILKGAVIGAALGYGAHALGQATGFSNPWLTFGLIGAFVGLFVGKPIWSLIRDKNATIWISVLKSAFGFGIGCGLYALIARAISPSWIISDGINLFTWPVTLGGAIGAVYGGFVELDDAMGDDKTTKGGKADAGKASSPSAPKKK